MSERHASCSCGALRISARGEPVRISICHCLACQRRSGSVFAAQARFPRDRVHIDGEAREYLRVADSGNTLCFRFCPACGATVYLPSTMRPISSRYRSVLSPIRNFRPRAYRSMNRGDTRGLACRTARSESNERHRTGTR